MLQRRNRWRTPPSETDVTGLATQRTLRHGCWVIAGATVLGCGRGPIPANAAPAAAARPAAIPDAAAPDAPPPTDPPIALGPRWRREDGCARDWAPTGDPSRDVLALGKICAQGMAPVSPEPSLIRVLPGHSARIAFTLTGPPTCLRAALAANSGGLSLAVLGPRGEILAGVSSTDSAAVAPPDGPVCVREGGTYTLFVSVPAADASGTEITVSAKAWRTSD